MTLDGIPEKYNDGVVDIVDTFITLKDKDGNSRIVQRDLYGAMKLLFLNKKKVVKVGKNSGNEYEDEEWEFDQEGFEAYFNEHYKETEEILLNLIKLKKLNVNINGTILGTN